MTLDYRWKEFLVSASCMTLSISDFLFRNEKGVKLEKKLNKHTYLNEVDVKRPLVISISRKSEQLRAYGLV
jgi:hypothetical protein